MGQLKKRLIKILAACAVFALSYWLGSTFRNTYYYTTMFCCPIAVLYIWIQFLLILYDIRFVRRILKKLQPYAAPLVNRIKSWWSHAANVLLKWVYASSVYQKIEYRRWKDTSRITGYSDEYHHNLSPSSSREYDAIPLKWRKCENNAQRIRCIYRKYVETNRKAGKPFSYASTPTELQKKWFQPSSEENDRLLMQLYYPARYDESETSKTAIPDDIVEHLKQTL